MKPTHDFGAELLENSASFRDPFFQRFRLRRAPQPLRLTDAISKDYLFPTLYADVRCAIGIFHCDYERARALLPHPRMVPVRMTMGRSLVAFSCYEYRNVLGVAPYNEIAMTIPVMVDAKLDIPVLPMLLGMIPGFGYYVFGMPVTSKENQIRGNRIWGLPKVTQEIDILEDGGDCVTEARDDTGSAYFKLRVPMAGRPTRFDVRAHLYSQHEGSIVRSQTQFRGTFAVTKHMVLLARKDAHPDRTYLEIGSGPAAATLRSLGIEQHPFQFRYTASMSSAFDLPSPDYRLPHANGGGA
jgi:hypothetical protein